MCKRNYAFKMNVMEEIRSSIEILANDIKVDTTDQYMLYSKELQQFPTATLHVY